MSVDSLVQELALSRVDFVKLDVEGSEAEAIQGSSRVLHDFRPVVVAAAYHRPADSEDLTALLAALTESYQVGPHEPFFGVEPQVIGIPQERPQTGRNPARK